MHVSKVGWLREKPIVKTRRGGGNERAIVRLEAIHGHLLFSGGTMLVLSHWLCMRFPVSPLSMNM